MKLEYKNISGNDLVASFYCTCFNEDYKGTLLEGKLKKRMHIYGYNDYNFFNKVNAVPRKLTCNCGKEYMQQWFDDGYVEVSEVK